MFKWVWKLLRWLNVFVIIALILAYLSPYVSPVIFWPIGIFGLAYPWLLLISIILLIAFFVKKERVAWLTLLSIIAGSNHLVNVFGINLSTPNAFGNTVTVLSNNAQNMRHTEFRDLEDKLELTENFMTLYKKFNPDILCIQESYTPKGVRNYIDNYYASQLEVTHKHSVANISMYSKYPIINKGEVRYNDAHRTVCIFMDIKVDNEIIRIYNLHLQSNRITKDAQEVVSEKKLKQKSTWKKIKSISERIGQASRTRALEAEKIKAHIDGSPHKVIVCGDFNDIPVSYSYAKIARGLKDSFIRHSFGLGSTYAYIIPALRIDYILASPELQIIRHFKSPKTHSDHYPVVSEIAY